MAYIFGVVAFLGSGQIQNLTFLSFTFSPNPEASDLAEFRFSKLLISPLALCVELLGEPEQLSWQPRNAKIPSSKYIHHRLRILSN